MRKNAIIILLLSLVLASCSTQKNTGATRAFHSMKVKYNIYYNGQLAYDEGIKQIHQSHTDDYSDVLLLYPVSDHKAAESSAGKMDRTIEKCRKCIKLHSIKKKPKSDHKKMRDPKYRQWLKQEEFNPSMPMAWIRLGQAEFHKGDFLGAVSTFAYIQRHFSYDKDLVAQSQLWQVRSYAEMDWLYEAEDLMSKVQADDLSPKHASLYSAVMADLLLKQKRYHEAIPYVKLAKVDENKKTSRPRFEYVLGQLYEKEGNRNEALEAYRRVLKLTPEWVMDFNARLRITQLNKNTRQAHKDLDKMIRRDKYKDYLDLLYGAKGNIYLQKGDTARALEQFALAVEKSTKNGPEKAAILIQSGDIYFGQLRYILAQPCYADAANLMTNTDEDYSRVKKRSEVLGDLVMHTNTVVLQDSLQRLSHLSEEEQMAVVNQIIADLIEQERQDSIAAAQAARAEENGDNTLGSVNTSNMVGGGVSGSGQWYFYNPNLIRTGKQTFRQKWGNRTLEDNWRRKIKTQVSMPSAEPENTDEIADLDSLSLDSLSVDSLSSKPSMPVVTDTHDPQYYLQQIPHSEDDYRQSDSLICDALYNLVLVYQDRLEDEKQAAQTFAQLRDRFPTDAKLLELYYLYYLKALKANDSVSAETYRQAIIQTYPKSNYAQVVSDPDYFNQLQLAQQHSDSLYEATYMAYKASEYETVKQLADTAQVNYPLSPLMPRFLFLRSVAVAKTDGQEPFIEALRDLLARYPESDMGSMARDMLSMMNQGLESQVGGTTSTLADRREQQAEEQLATDVAESPELGLIDTKLYISLPKNATHLNKLLYEVALFNFSQFMVKDFELETVENYSSTHSALKITGFESADEIEWYKEKLFADPDLQRVFKTLKADVE
ncbi:MAG: tetratricopeptide repeat protein [Paludibacteraceae bacterium]|nr:tetratricopeptide repeat protein [Paludibacteraceae bacterium]